MSDHEEANVNGLLSNKSITSVRVVIESIAVAAIIWLGTTVNQANLSIARLQVQLTEIQVSMADVPSLTRQVVQMQTEQADHDRRITRIEMTGTRH